MKIEKGFSLIEVILAIGIVGCGILCLMGLFTPLFLQVRDLEVMSELEVIKGKMDTFIQMRSFDEIYNMTKKQEIFYFYEDLSENGGQQVSNCLDEARGSRKMIKAQLFPSKMTDILSYGPTEYPESYFAIWVEINNCENQARDRKGCHYVVIKSR